MWWRTKGADGSRAMTRVPDWEVSLKSLLLVKGSRAMIMKNWFQLVQLDQGIHRPKYTR